MKLAREAIDHWCHGGVDRDEDHPDDERARNGYDSVFGPDIDDKRRFAEDHADDCGVQTGTPEPMAADLAVIEHQIVIEKVRGKYVSKK